MDTINSTTEHSGMRDKLGELKSRGLSKVHDVQQVLSSRTAVVKSNVQRSMTTANRSVRDEVGNRVTQIQSSMHTKPALWAGVAAGTGFALGLAGRFASSRRQHRPMIDIVVVEAY